MSLNKKLTSRLLSAFAMIAIGAWALYLHKSESRPRPKRITSGSQSTLKDALWRTDSALLLPKDCNDRKHGFRLAGVQFDLTSGATTKLPPMARTLPYFWKSARISPDGRWVLRPTVDGMEGNSLDGKVTRFWKEPQYHSWWSPIWLDSERWAIAERGGPVERLLVFSRKTPKPIRSEPLPHLMTEYSLPEFPATILLGPTSDGHLIGRNAFAFSSYDEETVPASRVILTELNPTVSPMTAQQYTVNADSNERLLEVAISPQGDRLAWVAWQRKLPSPWLVKLSRWLPIHSHPWNVLQIRTSRIDGTAMRVVYEVETTPTQAWDNYSLYDANRPWRLRWLPSGKAVSYCLFKSQRDQIGELYTLPID